MTTTTTEKNAAAAAAAAVDYVAYAAWQSAGADPAHDLDVPAMAIAYHPPANVELLAAIAAAGTTHHERAAFALGQPAETIAALVAAHTRATATVEEWLDEDGGSGSPPPGGACGPLPPPPQRDDDRFRP